MNDELKTFLTDIEQATGAELWFIGGIVRDTILGVPCNDIDLLARGLSQDDLNAALEKFGKVDVTGAVFGVTRFRPFDRRFPMSTALVARSLWRRTSSPSISASLETASSRIIRAKGMMTE